MKKFLLILLVACKCLMASVFQLQDGNENNQAITLNNNDGNGFEQNFEQIITQHLPPNNQFLPQVNENLFPVVENAIWQMPGLGAFVPDQNNPNLVNAVLGVPILNQAIDLLDENDNHPLHGTILIAKKRPATFNNGLGALQNHGANLFDNLENRSHTERQLVNALLNRADIDGNTAGDLWIYTPAQPCQIIVANNNDNQGRSCVTHYQQLITLLPNINIHVLFRNVSLTIPTIVDDKQLFQNLVNFLSLQFNGNQFLEVFSGYRLEGQNNTLQFNTAISKILSAISHANVPDNIRNTIRGILFIDNGSTINNWENVIENNQITDFVRLVNGFIGPNNQNCPANIRNSIFNAIYATQGITYTKIG